MYINNDLAVIILAAGSASRMDNHPKQLLCYDNQTFLEIAIQKALQLTPNVYVVLGHRATQCQKAVENYPVYFVYNTYYEQGIGSSIKVGINNTQDYAHTMVMLCDQPFIPYEHLRKLYSLQLKHPKQITASCYGLEATKAVVPALFPCSYYDKLMNLHGDSGAKALLQSESVNTIVLDKVWTIDIDTFEDVARYLTVV